MAGRGSKSRSYCPTAPWSPSPPRRPPAWFGGGPGRLAGAALVGVAVIGRRPWIVCVGCAVLAAALADGALAGLDPVEAGSVSGWVTLVDDPVPLDSGAVRGDRPGEGATARSHRVRRGGCGVARAAGRRTRGRSWTSSPAAGGRPVVGRPTGGRAPVDRRAGGVGTRVGGQPPRERRPANAGRGRAAPAASRARPAGRRRARRRPRTAARGHR